VKGDRDIDGHSDCYSLGATFYYMLTGRMVFNGANAQEVLTKHLVATLISPKVFNPKISGRTVRIIKKMMAKNRDKRYQTMSDLVQALDCDSKMKMFIRVLWIIGAGIVVFTSGIVIERFFTFSRILLW
jgi:serine/threonine protein kinase